VKGFLSVAKASGDILLLVDAHLEFGQGLGSMLMNALDLHEQTLITPCITVLGDDSSRGCGFKWANLATEVYWL